MPINQPEDQPEVQLHTNPQLLEKLMKQLAQKTVASSEDKKAQEALEIMTRIVFDGQSEIKNLTKLTTNELSDVLVSLRLLKVIKFKNQDVSPTSEGFELFNSINDRCRNIVTAIRDNRIDQKKEENETSSFLKKTAFQAFRKLARGVGYPQERKITEESRYAIKINSALVGISANLSSPRKETEDLMNKASADILAEELPHVPGYNKSNNTNQGGSGGNTPGPSARSQTNAHASESEKQRIKTEVEQTVREAFAQAKKAKEANEANEFARKMPRPPSRFPHLINVPLKSKVLTPPPPGPQGSTPPPLGRDTEVDGYNSDSGYTHTSDDFSLSPRPSYTFDEILNKTEAGVGAGVSPSPSPRNSAPQTKFDTRLSSLFLRPRESRAATRAPSYQPPRSEEPENSPAAGSSNTPQKETPDQKGIVEAGIGFFEAGAAKAKIGGGIVAARDKLLETQASGQQAFADIERRRQAALRARRIKQRDREKDGRGRGAADPKTRGR
jgi:hypothetical protein